MYLEYVRVGRVSHPKTFPAAVLKLFIAATNHICHCEPQHDAPCSHIILYWEPLLVCARPTTHSIVPTSLHVTSVQTRSHFWSLAWGTLGPMETGGGSCRPSRTQKVPLESPNKSLLHYKEHCITANTRVHYTLPIRWQPIRSHNPDTVVKCCLLNLARKCIDGSLLKSQLPTLT